MDEVNRKLSGWMAGGQLRHLEDVSEGLASAPLALRRVLDGENVGKAIVHVAEPLPLSRTDSTHEQNGSLP